MEFISFCIQFGSSGDLVIYSVANPDFPKYKLIQWLFSGTTSPKNWKYEFLIELLTEIDQILSGEKPTLDKEVGLRDFYPTGDLFVYNDVTIFSMYDEEKNRTEILEVSTNEFRFLLNAWIKFVRVNFDAFIQMK